MPLSSPTVYHDVILNQSSTESEIYESSDGQKMISIVCISDTHGDHRALSDTIPSGEILIHAGDYSLYGKRDDAADFNVWLGELK